MDATRKPRKTLLVNLSWTAALSVVLIDAYVLSYAPVYRWMHGPTPTHPVNFSFKAVRGSARRIMTATEPDPRGSSSLLLFRPVDVLIDRTPLREPLFWWADCFGVRHDFEFMHGLRTDFFRTSPSSPNPLRARPGAA